MKLTKNLSILLALSVSLIGGIYYYWTGTPEYSLLQIKHAVDTHNTQLFNKHVDVKEVIGRTVDTIMEQAIDNSTSSELSSAEAFGSEIVAGMAAMMKPKIIEYAKSKIEKVIEGDSAPQNEEVKNSQTNNKSIANIESFFSGEDSLNKSYLKKEENIAYLGLERFDKKLQDVLTLEFKLRKMDGYWQIVEISNLKEMIRRSEDLKNKRIAKINQPIREQLNATVTITNVAKKNVKINRWKEKVLIGVLLTNHTTEKITDLVFKCDLMDENKNIVHNLNLRVSELPVAKEQELVWEFEINNFIKQDKILLELPEGQLNYQIEVTNLTLANGEIIELMSSL